MLWTLGLLSTCLSAGIVQAARDDARVQAKEILEISGVDGGIVAHLGCGDGRLTAALHLNDRYTVHGLEADPANVAAARDYIAAQGIYGVVSVEPFTSASLPYAENLINLVVVQEMGKVPMEEIMRVLAPGGAACIRRDGKWEKMTKPWPDNIDQWTHFLHDASNNAVADDSAVGPPRSLQWMAPPLWLRSHETPSGIQAAVSANGRLFYFFDEGLIGVTDERLPDRWSLICRDAFNGKLLWRRPIESWGWRQWSPGRYQGKDWTTLSGTRTDVPAENQRRLVADGDRLYATLGYEAPMSILDAATGNVIATVEATRNTREILVSEGIAVASVRRGGAGNKAETSLVAVNGKTGAVSWEKGVGQIRPLSWAIDKGRVVCLSGKTLTALNLKDGEQLWSVPSVIPAPRTLLIAGDVAVMQDGKSVAACDAASGKPLWDKTVPPIAGGEGEDLFVIDGLVWRGMLTVDDDGEPVNKSPNALVIGWDLRTGEEKKRILVKNLRSPEHHHRCYRNKATTRYLISSYEGAEFLDFQGDNHCQNNWLRSACRLGMMPCNGMLYVPPDQCFCEPGAKLLGFAAVTAQSRTTVKMLSDDDRLEKGPAYGLMNPMGPVGDADWPTYRHDPARSGATDAGVASDVRIDWQSRLDGPLTTPVVAAGMVFIARPDAHTLYALSARTGEVQWKFTADGRIDSPPTIYHGLALFGSKDGYAYCLRASDGQLVWRFLAAPADRRIACFDQIESAWRSTAACL